MRPFPEGTWDRVAAVLIQAADRMERSSDPRPEPKPKRIAPKPVPTSRAAPP
jgi:hypothetical protein